MEGSVGVGSITSRTTIFPMATTSGRYAQPYKYTNSSMGISVRSELHAFSDASGKTYAAAVYLRGLSPSGDWMSSLLVAKTKVAPLKLTSIPRLELCGALLAARLLRKVADGLCFSEEALYAWRDASVVLSWIRTHPSKWEPFVANRVTVIQDLVPAEKWRR